MRFRQLVTVMAVTMALTACEGKTLSLYSAKIKTFNNQVCVMIDAKKGEYLNMLEISSSDEKETFFRRYFSSQESETIPLTADTCVPVFNYPFREGYAYGVMISTMFKGAGQNGGRNFVASFTLYRAGGELSATSL
ncbi:putative T6SS immunity periplasmic lipoprotein [Mixta intestinalis]|uniref:DUF7480 domain-containing protein n=1 Tax=Mixta intestinalis TaxID=1615494 RepID=A0A6P1PYW9_9GAMM|nr:putative T6SS immunity periplasmic lipoprotein [Mixta intestinalis]QHM71361.1 hypothetical protein C7M51_01647 [Mixta intestinalis]